MAYGIDEINNNAREYSSSVNTRCDLVLAKLEYKYKTMIAKVESIRNTSLSSIEHARCNHCNSIDPNGFSAASASDSMRCAVDVANSLLNELLGEKKDTSDTAD